MTTGILTLSCPDRPGLVHAVSGYLVDVRGQHRGERAVRGRRHRSASSCGSASTCSTTRSRSTRCGAASLPIAAAHDMTWEIVDAADADPHARARVEARALPQRPAVPHPRRHAADHDPRGRLEPRRPARRSVEGAGIAYHHIPVTPDGKADAERRLLDLVHELAGRPRRARPLHAGPLGRHLHARSRPCDQHPPLVPARVRRRQAVPPGPRARA